MTEPAQTLHAWLGEQLAGDWEWHGAPQGLARAIREVVRLHRPSTEGLRLGHHPAPDQPDERPVIYSCEGCHETPQECSWTYDINECPVLRVLAWPYRDQPGYREDWLPRWGEDG